VVRVASATPFGLVWWSKDVELALPTPVYVAPRLGAPLAGVEVPDQQRSGGLARERSVGGELRAVREYRHGDSPRRVHWPATAHGTTLMVRENEEALGSSVLVRADLPEEPAAAEARAERVLGTLAALLDAGVTVRLESTEAGGRRVEAVVPDRRHAGRRLAAACPTAVLGEPSGPPDTSGPAETRGAAE
jgi:uncharacterized protein (DUF58 family)